MLKPELYQRTVDILVQAYFEDTLEHSNCRACAVGNIVAANTGITLCKRTSPIGIYPKNFIPDNLVFDSGIWFKAIHDGFVDTSKITPEITEQVNATGYTAEELALIEDAFETAQKGDSDDEWMFNGLMAVINVLDKIHENTDTQVTATTKQRFQKA